MTIPQALVHELRISAVCNTTHPADAATALIVAAVEILSLRFEPARVAELIVAGTRDAVLLSQPTGSA